MFLSDTTLSPDGRRLAFRRSTPEEEAIWVSALTGDAPVRLGNEPGKAFQRFPAWSPDGNEIVYSSARNGRDVLVRARVGGVGGPVVIAGDAGTSPRWSPKGDLIAALGPGDGLTVLSSDGTSSRRLGSGNWLLHGWSADGQAILGVRQRERVELVKVDVRIGGESVLAAIPVDPAALTVGMALGMEPMTGFTPASDGSGFLTSILNVNADIWTLER
jgi:Tol biopolymer transport system component